MRPPAPQQSHPRTCSGVLAWDSPGHPPGTVCRGQDGNPASSGSLLVSTQECEPWGRVDAGPEGGIRRAGRVPGGLSERVALQPRKCTGASVPTLDPKKVPPKRPSENTAQVRASVVRPGKAGMDRGLSVKGWLVGVRRRQPGGRASPETLNGRE